MVNNDNGHIEDCLDRDNFLDFLNMVIERLIQGSINSEIKAVCIDGEWGSGKSWILEEFAERNKDEYLIFHYNAWNNDIYDEPLVGILVSMIESINSSKNIEVLINRYGNAIKQGAICELKQVAEEIISSIEIKGVKIGRLFNFFKKLNFKSKIPFSDNLKHISVAINKVSRVLAKINVPIIIMVDELDRCLPEYAIKVLERLHHISSLTNIIQIVALNEKSIAYGIAKVYGRFDLLNKQGGNNTDILDFASLYLKKLFNIFLPLNNGKIGDNKVELFFDRKFLINLRDFRTNKVIITEIKLNIDKEYFNTFYSKLFKGVSIREQQRIVDLVQICHSITMERTLSDFPRLSEFEYQHLIWEILICIKLFITKKHQANNWFRVHYLSKDAKYKPLTCYSTFSIADDKIVENKSDFYKIINDNLLEIFSNFKTSGSNDTISIATNESCLQIYNNESFILAYYCLFGLTDYSREPSGITHEWLVNKIVAEQKFLQEFQRNMSSLVT